MPDTYQGSLFSHDFLTDSVTRLASWTAIDDAAADALTGRLRAIFDGFPGSTSPNESQTEDDLIWPVLARVGWTASLRQQNLAPKGRVDVPDGLLFADDDAKSQANRTPEEWRRYEFGRAIVESKRWNRPLDRQSGRRGEETAPSTQMLRYLRRVEDLTTGKLRWGMLTNGNRWRLYYQGARSVSEQFFEIDLAMVLGVAGHDGGLFALSDADRRHWVRVFVLVFGRDAFLGTPSDARTFHQRALDEGRYYEERVAASLSELVFGDIFPRLAREIAAAAPDAALPDVREAALILLYRLLFILYAEDRDLLPVRDPRYAEYGLRDKVRGDIGKRMDREDVFSPTRATYWSTLDELCRAIDAGDPAIGLPAYDGGLFDRARTPLLTEIRLSDATMAHVIDAMSFERTPEGRKYINYRDLSVQQLGSIYERMLEHEVVRDGTIVDVRPNIFARKGSGSYYTPDDLVALIVRETVGPLIQERMDAFRAREAFLATSSLPEHERLTDLKFLDPARAILSLKICDPAMGSGHFLVALVDYLTDQVIATMAESESLVTWSEYVPPLDSPIDDIRTLIRGNGVRNGWTIGSDQLDDRHIVRRMVLKRCVYGVDKNPMAVELAKVALWLHTFTVGAPLSFLDHHLRSGDSLFGCWVRAGIDKTDKLKAPLFFHEPLSRTVHAAAFMQQIETFTDSELAEARASKAAFEGVKDMTGPLNALLSLVHAIDWLEFTSPADRHVLSAYLTGQFGDPVEIARGRLDPLEKEHKSKAAQAEAVRLAEMIAQARQFIAEENFLHWQVAFPGVWSAWESQGLTGGFDAVVGNPPWDRMKLQEVEWFAARRREIALAQRASDRKRMVAALEKANDPLAQDYARAAARAEAGVRMARKTGDYPLLSGGDVNIYSLFVERAMQLVKTRGMVGLLTPSGIASDKTAAPFFKGLSTTGRLKALYDFENRRTRFDVPPFFPDVDSRFKFCVTIASPARTFEATRCAFFLQDISELEDPERCFPLGAEDFARVNPNTGTAPIFRTRRDAALTTAIYERLPVLVDRSGGGEVKAWPVRYMTMFHMTNDSGLFRTRRELEEKEGAYPVKGNRYQSAAGDWVPLYVGRMVHQFDHRAASVVINPANLHNPALSNSSLTSEKRNSEFAPAPQFWVQLEKLGFSSDINWVICFRDIARATDARTVIATIGPATGYGNTLPVLLGNDGSPLAAKLAAAVLANLNVISFDYVARQKIQGQHLNWFIMEQLPVIPLEQLDRTAFGPKSAAEIVREAVLELTYTAHDMAPFARDMGYVNARGQTRPPFRWNEARRLRLRAKLDAVYFHLYGITDRDDVRYIYSTFPIVEREETAAHGRYLSRDLCLAWMNALAAGNPDAEIELA